MWWSSSSPWRGSRPAAFAALVLALFTASLAGATEVRIDIQKAAGRKVQVALAPFAGLDLRPDESQRLRDVLANDLRLSGFFEIQSALPAGVSLNGRDGKPETFDRLAGQGAELLVNVIVSSADGKSSLEGFVFDTGTRQQLFGKRYRGPDWARTKIVHVMAGEMIQELTGVRPLTKSRLAFCWNINGKKQIFVSDYDGGNPQEVSPRGTIALFPEWHPDGQRLSYTSFATGLPELVLADVDNGQSKVLSAFPGMNTAATFAPDGSHVLATLSKDGNPEIYRLDLRGGIQQRLTSDQGVDTSPSYAPDGREFVFVSDRSGGPQLYRLPAGGGTPTRLTFQGTYNTAPAWSPGGKYIAYSGMVDRRFELLLLNLETREVTQLTAGPGNKEDPSWGIDERHLVFTLTNNFKSEICILDIYSKEVTRITQGKGDFTSPEWSAGGP